MIGNDKGLRRICRNYELVENYAKAIADEENKWHLHHRREIDEMKSAQQLKDEGKYYDVKPQELIFLTKSEHTKLHNKNQLAETKHKISEALKGEKNPMFGKRHTEETKKKISDSNKGKKASADAKKKMSDSRKGKHWYNNGIVEIKAKECPEGFVKGRLRKNSFKKLFKSKR